MSAAVYESVPVLNYVFILTLGILGLMDVTAARHNRDNRPPLCSEVHSRCFGRDGCKFALENYFLHCLDITEHPVGASLTCTPHCKMALIMLLSSEEHDGPAAFRDCDCEGEEFCLQQKERMSVCQDDVQVWLDAINDPSIPITCSLATLVCSADSTCLMAIDYYEDHCKRLQDATNPRCNSRCNNSLNILYRQERAAKLQTCYCDGSEGYNCTLLKRNTQELCFGPRVRHHNGGHSRRPHQPRPTPPPTQPVGDPDIVDNAIIDKHYQVSEGSNLHNSAYTIHNSAGLCCYRQCVLWHIVTLLLLIYILRDR